MRKILIAITVIVIILLHCSGCTDPRCESACAPYKVSENIRNECVCDTSKIVVKRLCTNISIITVGTAQMPIVTTAECP